MIELDQPDTWPGQILNILKDRASNIKAEKELEDQSLCDGSYILNPVYCNTYDKSVEEIKNILISNEVRGYHCTKVINRKDIERKGLTVLRPKVLLGTVCSELKSAGIDREELDRVKRAFEEFEKNGCFARREGLLWFVLSKRLTDYRGCEEFFGFFGGEAARRALWPVKDTVYPLLNKIGIPTVVECRLSVSDAMDYQVNSICKEMINYGIQAFALNKEYSLQCEMCVKHDVMPNNIIAIWEKHI